MKAPVKVGRIYYYSYGNARTYAVIAFVKASDGVTTVDPEQSIAYSTLRGYGFWSESVDSARKYYEDYLKSGLPEIPSTIQNNGRLWFGSNFGSVALPSLYPYECPKVRTLVFVREW